MLSCTEYNQPYWLTFLQANKLGGSIRSGERAETFVVFARESVYRSKDADGNEILKRGFVLKYSPVFNIEQTRGIEAPAEVEIEIKDAEEYIQQARCKPLIKYGGDRAYYHPGGDCIQMPPKEQFTGTQGYYETLLHEIGRWTGAKNRLNRDFSAAEATRAREELTAEMFAGFTLSKVGLDRDIKNLSAYIQSWIEALNSDRKAVVVAAREAKKAVEYFESGELPGST
jgi:antirestriction protein ArdC